MKRPARILIPVPTSFDPAYNQLCWPEYAAAIQAAGAVPVEVTLQHTAAELDALAADCDGIVLPGSPADVDPAHYGHERDPASAPADVEREQTDFALLDAAERLGKPLLAICFGLQSLNARRGGTLLQNLPPVPVNHSAGRAVAAAHTVLVAESSRLGLLLSAPDHAVSDPGADGGLRLRVNSSHHQAVGIPGEGLRIAARSSEDGVIEALESAPDDSWLVGVQWHPERTGAAGDATARDLFAAFVQAAGS